ncbi:LysR substrate-binding domain-containing protein [Aquisalimonas asiatica]|uniref:DNA-binding transcriptional regulator, LysR family n=1 Tax=Aquisalimonas asiatica TaxID=406100 RepID=A0A1H8SJJ0_9GAMM|nr:LysR family transcriptional regulator [Aquisalimonas asiatica]SEO78725.1 DNA-binding transcriptional regulator, LysR family [Aquisalimonas asiatica]
MIDLKVSQIRYFLLVAEHGGFHAAAEHAHRTQPAISQAVRELERKLGEPLLEKGGKVQLTPYGEQAMPMLQGLVDHHDRVGEELQRLAHHEVGLLHIATVPSVASRLLPGLLEAFIRDHPGLDVTVQDGSADSVMALVKARQVDFGITSALGPLEEFRVEPVYHDRIGVVFRDDHPLATATGALAWEALRPYKLIRNGTSRLLEHTEAAPLLAGSQLYVSNMISLLALLEAGMGITTLPRLALPPDHPRLRFRPLGRPQVEREISIVRPARRSLSPAAALLERAVLEASAGWQSADTP